MTVRTTNGVGEGAVIAAKNAAAFCGNIFLNISVVTFRLAIDADVIDYESVWIRYVPSDKSFE